MTDPDQPQQVETELPALIDTIPPEVAQTLANTATGLPYPLDTEAVMLGAQAIKALAEAIDRRFRVVSATVDVTSTNAHTLSTTMTVTIPGLAVGDYCLWMGHGSLGGQFHFWTFAICTVAGQISFRGFNADATGVDPSPDTHYFLVIAHA